MKIIIEGDVGEGKTTLAIRLAEHLQLLGFEIEQLDEDVVEERNLLSPTMQAHRLAGIVQMGVKISIETKQTRRSV